MDAGAGVAITEQHHTCSFARITAHIQQLIDVVESTTAIVSCAPFSSIEFAWDTEFPILPESSYRVTRGGDHDLHVLVYLKGRPKLNTM